MTGASENRPARASAAAARSASSATPGAGPAVLTIRRRSPASTSRTACLIRDRGNGARSDRSSRADSTASTEGSERSALRSRVRGSSSAGGKLGLHPLPDARDHLVRLPPDRLQAGAAHRALRQSPHRLLAEAGPELVEIPRGETLALEGGNPFARQLTDEAIALDGEPAGPPHQLGQPRRHRYSFTSRRTVSPRLASNRPVDTHGNTRSDLSLPEEPRR